MTTRTPFFAAAIFATFALAPTVHAQGLSLNSGDTVTVSGAGTIGTINGAPVANTTTAYNDRNPTTTAVLTSGTAVFTLGTGGTLTATVFGDYAIGAYGTSTISITGGSISANQYGYGIWAASNVPITFSGGSITTGSGGVGIYAYHGSVIVTGGIIDSGQDTFGQYGRALFANGGFIDVYGAFDGLTLGQTQTLPTGFSSFTGTLENNTTAQTFKYQINAVGGITLHDVGLVSAPEPSQFAAFAIGFLGLGVLVTKAKKRQPNGV